MAHIGAGLGSYLAKTLKLNARERRLLLLAGAAGAISALLRTPLGAALWALEVLYQDDFESEGMFSCLVSSVTAYSVMTLFFEPGSLFHVSVSYEFIPAQLLFYGALGLACALFGALWIRWMHGSAKVWSELKLPTWAKPALGGLLLGALVIWVPWVFSTGFEWIQDALRPVDDASRKLPIGFTGFLLLLGPGDPAQRLRPGGGQDNSSRSESRERTGSRVLLVKSFRGDWLQFVRLLAAQGNVDRGSPADRRRPRTTVGGGRATEHPRSDPHSAYRHDVLVHEDDEDLVAGTRGFVEQGLASGGQVLVHGTRGRVGLLREVLGDHPRLEYGFDEELYQEPTKTLFAYQHRLAEMPDPADFWVTGTVPLGRDAPEQAAWARYESAVNEALSDYSFRALCTYDTRTNPDSVIEAALATHPGVSTALKNRPSVRYVDPAKFLVDPMAQVPRPPERPPSLVTTVDRLEHLPRVRYLLETTARSSSAVSPLAVDEFVTAVNEVAANGVVHGAPPVLVTLWADVTSLTCQVRDSGAGAVDPLAGFRYPDESGPMGLWAARQLVDDLFVTTPSWGGCNILLTRT